MNTNMLHRHLFFVDDPHPSSFASLLLLNKHLRAQDYNHPRTWMNARRKFMFDFQKKHGAVHCEYCGKTGLKISTKNLDRIATIDHATPCSVTKRRYDPKNFRIACNKCNVMKGTMSEFQFRRHLFISAIRRNRAVKNIVKLFGKYCLCSIKMCLTLI